MVRIGLAACVFAIVFVVGSSGRANDCPRSCNGSTAGCAGVDAQVTITCGDTRCLVEISVNGNGGSGSNSKRVPKDGNEPVSACCTGSSGTCCVAVFPCSGSDWSAAASSCGALCHDCLES